jgi:hypothetical protein
MEPFIIVAFVLVMTTIFLPQFEFAFFDSSHFKKTGYFQCKSLSYYDLVDSFHCVAVFCKIRPIF